MIGNVKEGNKCFCHNVPCIYENSGILILKKKKKLFGIDFWMCAPPPSNLNMMMMLFLKLMLHFISSTQLYKEEWNKGNVFLEVQQASKMVYVHHWSKQQRCLSPKAKHLISTCTASSLQCLLVDVGSSDPKHWEEILLGGTWLEAALPSNHTYLYLSLPKLMSIVRLLDLVTVLYNARSQMWIKSLYIKYIRFCFS